MTLVQLEYALAVQKSGSIVGAAEACRVTQPTLTQQLQKLEEELGGALFERGRHPLSPTALGRKVLDQAARVQAEAKRLRALALEDQGPPSGVYRLGVIPSVAGSLLPRATGTFLKRYPGVSLQVVERQSRDLVRDLFDGVLDAGIAALPLKARGLASTELYREGFLAYFPEGHPLLGSACVEPKALGKERVLLMGEGHCFRHQALSLCKTQPDGDGVHLESGSFHTLAALVDAGQGVTLLPEMEAKDLGTERRLRLRPLSGGPAVRSVGMVHVRPAPKEKTARALAAVIREAVPTAKSGRVLSPGVEF